MIKLSIQANVVTFWDFDLQNLIYFHYNFQRIVQYEIKNP
jgi:hypothetical protein